MNASEYLAFIPLLMFGIGLTDLLSEWKRLLQPKRNYLPYILFTIMLTEIGIYNVFIYFKVANTLGGDDYLEFLVYMWQPLLFILITNSFIPDKGADTKEYFWEKFRVYIPLCILLVGVHFFYSFDEPKFTGLFRAVLVGVMIITLIAKKEWLVYTIIGIWILMIGVREGTKTPDSEEQASIEFKAKKIPDYSNPGLDCKSDFFISRL